MIEIEHVQRWKKEFPEYFKKEEVGENEPPKNKVPKFCKGPNNWRDWFNKQEPFVRGMFNWKTNEYDIRLVFACRFESGPKWTAQKGESGRSKKVKVDGRAKVDGLSKSGRS